MTTAVTKEDVPLSPVLADLKMYLDLVLIKANVYDNSVRTDVLIAQGLLIMNLRIPLDKRNWGHKQISLTAVLYSDPSGFRLSDNSDLEALFDVLVDMSDDPEFVGKFLTYITDSVLFYILEDEIKNFLEIYSKKYENDPKLLEGITRVKALLQERNRHEAELIAKDLERKTSATPTPTGDFSAGLAKGPNGVQMDSERPLVPTH